MSESISRCPVCLTDETSKKSADWKQDDVKITYECYRCDLDFTTTFEDCTKEVTESISVKEMKQLENRQESNCTKQCYRAEVEFQRNSVLMKYEIDESGFSYTVILENPTKNVVERPASTERMQELLKKQDCEKLANNIEQYNIEEFYCHPEDNLYNDIKAYKTLFYEGDWDIFVVLYGNIDNGYKRIVHDVRDDFNVKEITKNTKEIIQ